MSNVHTVYLVHHSHTDVGYTHDQPILWDLYQRFIDEAVDLTEKYAGSDSDGAFRWTVENFAPLQQWLKNATSEQVERFVAMEQAGRIEVTGMFANLTPLFDADQLVESFQGIRQLRQKYGFNIRYGMNCDVNGENWPLADILADLGIEGFSMAINIHFGGYPLKRPYAFNWQGPGGGSVMAWNGWTYDTGWRFAIGRDAQEFEETWWPRIDAFLDKTEYPLPTLMIQSYHPFGDNGSAFEQFSHFINRWNEQGKTPRIVLATPSMWWASVKEHSHLLPTHRGDWTDYWNFGCASSAREQAINRANRTRLRTADALSAVVLGADGPSANLWLAKSYDRYREEAWRNLHLWDEHTWGADLSIHRPNCEDAASQWYHKANYAYQARSLSLMLQRDGLADFARGVTRSEATDVVVFNPLPWSRQISGQIPQGVITPRGVPEDTTAGRHTQDRMLDIDYLAEIMRLLQNGDLSVGKPPGKLFVLPPVEVPGFGYKVVAQDELVDLTKNLIVNEAVVVENGRFRLAFDLEKGGIRSWYDKQLDHEWVDQSADYACHRFVYEEVADRQHSWARKLMFDMDWDPAEVDRERGWKTEWRARREQPTAVTRHRVYQTPLGTHIVQHLAAPGCQESLVQTVFLPNFADYIECEAWWEMGLDSHPQATYLLFPFNIPNATARIDLGGQAIIPGTDQLAGSCHDYYTVQQWVDFNNQKLGVVVALPDNPMVQFGDFHFGHNQAEFMLERAMLLGWVTNNYWETNFRAHQPGRVHSRYRILPYKGAFDEGQAHRFGLEVAHARPLLQQLGEPTVERPSLPAEGSIINLPNSDGNSPVLTLHVKAAQDHEGVIVRLLNASDEPHLAEIKSGEWQITGAQLCDLLEQPEAEVPVENDRLQFIVQPRRITTLRLIVRANG